VLDGDALEDLAVARRGVCQRQQLVVVVAAAADGVLEDRRVRRHAPEPVVDERLQLTRAEHAAAQIIQPYALAQVEQSVHGGLGALGHWYVLPCMVATQRWCATS